MTDRHLANDPVSFRAAGWLAAPDGESRASTTALIKDLVSEIERLREIADQKIFARMLADAYMQLNDVVPALRTIIEQHDKDGCIAAGAARSQSSTQQSVLPMNAVVETKRRPAASNPMQMLAIAVERGDDMEKLRQLMDLKDRWEAGEAKKAYVVAMSGFKSEPLQILKSKKVDIPGGAKFSHATLADVADGVCASLSKHGLSHRWETKQEGGVITVTCVMTHVDGHEERTTLSGAPDDSGKKNAIQQVASTVTYLERYTLMAACGLAAKDMDDDARAAGKKTAAAQDPEPEGYENWKADMKAKSDEGLAKLMESWSGCARNVRLYVIKYDDAWWSDLKAKAERVKVS